jgi:hypothetical protein
MTRRADSERIRLARRAAIRDTLIGGGMDRGVAERWCDAWQAEAALQGVERGSDYWDAGKRWIDAQCAARKLPPD